MWRRIMNWVGRRRALRPKRGPLTPAQGQHLAAMLQGQSLKSHRDIDGRKVYKLHDLEGTSVVIAPDRVESLRQAGYMETNHKFPVATYWLTESGKAAASHVVEVV